MPRADQGHRLQAARSPANQVHALPGRGREFDGLAGLNDYTTGSIGDLELLSSLRLRDAARPGPREVARRIAHTLRSPIDFSRLVRTAYDRGFRCFLEVGPSATCSRWIRDTLGDEPPTSPSPWTGAGCRPRIDRPARGPPRRQRPGAGPDAAAGVRPLPDLGRLRPRLPVPGRRRRPHPGACRRNLASLEPAGTADPRFRGRRAGNRPVRAGNVPSATVPSVPPEDSTVMPADPTLADAEVIAFDGTPISFLPGAPQAPGGRARHACPGARRAGRRDRGIRLPGPRGPWLPRRSPPRPPQPPGPRPRRPGTGVAADLVREIRQQMLATHSVVMETQHILQGAALRRVEGPARRRRGPALPDLHRRHTAAGPGGARAGPPGPARAGSGHAPHAHPRHPGRGRDRRAPPGAGPGATRSRTASSGTRPTCWSSPSAPSPRSSDRSSASSTATSSACGCPHRRTTSSPE